MGHNFFRAVIGHRHNAAPACHQRGSLACQRHKRIGADIVCGAEGFARCADKIAFQRLLWRERNRVEHKIDMIGFTLHLLEESGDLGVA